MAPRDRITFGLLQLEDRTTPAQFAPGQVLVGFLPGAEAVGLQSVKTDSAVSDNQPIGFGLYKLTLQSGVSVPAAISQLSGKPGVKFVEPNYIAKKAVSPNDPSFTDGTLWALRNTGQNGGTAGADTRATAGWDINTGTGATVVAVIDDGVEHTHPDLAANMWTNTREVPGNGADDDGNGFVDDVHGYDFSRSTGDILGGIIDDHGTHVAGSIGAVGNNGVGVSGMTWKTRIMTLPLFSSGASSGQISVAIQGMNYAVMMGAKVSNHSWGYSGPESLALRAAFDAANTAGHVAVCAAFNDAEDNDVVDSYPTDFYGVLPNVISVAAYDRNDQLAGFSNYGRRSVTLGAPGVEIFSTSTGGGYAFKQGTSMASPHVAGAVTLFMDAAGSLTPAEVVAAVKRSARQVAGGNSKTDTGGVLDLAALMRESGRGLYATGADAGGGPHVKVFRGFGSEVGGFMAYDARFTGGVRVAVGDVNGDGITDIITGAGPGGGPHLRVFNSKNFQELFGLFAFEAGFTGGITVATGDVNGDGRADIIVGADRGGGPRVTVFSLPVGATALVRIADFFAYDPAFRGGVNVAAGVFTAGGKQADVVTAPGRGGGPHVKRFSAASVTAGRPAVVGQAMVGDPANRSGLFVTTGDVNGDGVADIITGTAAGTPNVAITNGANMAPLSGMRSPFGGELPGLLNPADPLFVGSAYSPLLNNGLIAPGTPPNQLVSDAAIANAGSRAGYVYGVRVAAVDLNGDNRPEILVSGGPNDNAHVGIISGATLLPTAYFPAYVSSFFGGVFIGA